MNRTKLIVTLTLSFCLAQTASADCTSFIAEGHHQASQARITLNCKGTADIPGTAASIQVFAPTLQRIWIRIGTNFDRVHTPQVLGYVLEELHTVELTNSVNGVFSLDLSTLGLDPHKHYFFEAASISSFLGFTFYNVISDPGTFQFD